MQIKKSAGYIVFCLLVLITGCSQKVDGTSLEAFSYSIKEINKKLSPELQKQFDSDILTIMGSRNLTLGQVRLELDGKTQKEIHSIAYDINVTQTNAALDNAKKLLKEHTLAAENAKARMIEAKKIDILATYREGSDGYLTYEFVINNRSAFNLTHYDLEVRPASNKYHPMRRFIKDLAPPIPAGGSRVVSLIYDDWGGSKPVPDTPKSGPAAYEFNDLRNDQGQDIVIKDFDSHYEGNVRSATKDIAEIENRLLLLMATK